MCSRGPRAFIGNDVVDLRAVGGAAPLDEARAARHLTAAERARVTCAPAAFWAIFAAKEAAYKALSQAGIPTPYGAYTSLETRLDEHRVIHLPRAAEVEIVSMTMDAEKAHCVAMFPGFAAAGSGILASWATEEKPEHADPSDFGRERLAALIARCSGDRISAGRLAFASEGGVPKVFERGEPREFSVSLSHAGRFVACAVCM